MPNDIQQKEHKDNYNKVYTISKITNQIGIIQMTATIPKHKIVNKMFGEIALRQIRVITFGMVKLRK